MVVSLKERDSDGSIDESSFFKKLDKNLWGWVPFYDRDFNPNPWTRTDSNTRKGTNSLILKEGIPYPTLEAEGLKNFIDELERMYAQEYKNWNETLDIKWKQNESGTEVYMNGLYLDDDPNENSSSNKTYRIGFRIPNKNRKAFVYNDPEVLMKAQMEEWDNDWLGDPNGSGGYGIAVPKEEMAQYIRDLKTELIRGVKEDGGSLEDLDIENEEVWKVTPKEEKDSKKDWKFWKK